MASISTFVCMSLFSLINVDMPRRPDVVFGDAFVFSPIQSRLKKCERCTFYYDSYFIWNITDDERVFWNLLWRGVSNDFLPLIRPTFSFLKSLTGLWLAMGPKSFVPYIQTFASGSAYTSTFIFSRLWLTSDTFARRMTYIETCTNPLTCFGIYHIYLNFYQHLMANCHLGKCITSALSSMLTSKFRVSEASSKRLDSDVQATNVAAGDILLVISILIDNRLHRLMVRHSFDFHFVIEFSW